MPIQNTQINAIKPHTSFSFDANYGQGRDDIQGLKQVRTLIAQYKRIQAVDQVGTGYGLCRPPQSAVPAGKLSALRGINRFTRQADRKVKIGMVWAVATDVIALTSTEPKPPSRYIMPMIAP